MMIRKKIAVRVSAELFSRSARTSRLTRTASLRAITLTRVVSFSSEISSFSIGAGILVTACGTTTWRIAWKWLMPSERAASIWPRGHRFDAGSVDLGR